MMDGLSSKQKASEMAVNRMQKTASDIRSYLDKSISYSALQMRYKTLLDEQKQENTASITDNLREKVGDIERGREENVTLGRQVNEGSITRF